MTKKIKKIILRTLILCSTNLIFGQPNYPAPTGVWCSCPPTTGSGSGSVVPAVASKSYVKGILVRVAWKDIETSDNVFNWSLIDNQITAAQSYGKKISLAVGGGLNSPSWLYPLGVQSISYTIPFSGTIPIPWDTKFLAKWTEFIAELGNRYANDTTIQLVYITNSSANGFEMQLPFNPTPSYTSIGYTDQKVIDSWEEVIDAFNSSFPNHYLTNDFHPVNSSNVVADSIYAYSKLNVGSRYGANGWWWSQKNSTVYPSQFAILQNSTTTNLFTGIQMANSGITNPSSFGTGGMPTALSLAISNNICYWEIWNNDITNGSFDTLLSNAVCSPTPQTPMVYNETESSGMYFQGTNGAQVTNPVSDAVNSSANVARSATDGGWQQIQYFPNYTVAAGNKLYFSVHNPNGAGPGQVQFEYTTGGGWQFGGNVTYISGSTTGWREYSIDLTGHVGNTINKIILMPAGGSSAAVYVDNIYFASTSILPKTWIGDLNNSWTNAANWTNGVPTATDDVTIASAINQPIIASNVSIYSLTIDATASVTVNSPNSLTVTDVITNNGTLTIANDANLIQTNNVLNSGVGTTTVARNSNALSRNDYTIWSSPVSYQNMLAFSPATLTNRFYNYSEADNWYSAVTSPGLTPFVIGAGYLIRMPNNAVIAPMTQTFNGLFTGTVNNGNVSKAVAYSGVAKGYNMVGNPYPSTIDADAFIAANSANIESSLYFWRKINGAIGSAYAVYNAMGSTATPSSAVPNGTIQVGQGFFVKAKSGATSIDFTNAMRLGNSSTQFFRTKEVQKDRLWLNLTNTADAFSQTLVGYTAAATIGVDDFDAKYINDSEIALTSNINSEEYTIQGRPTFDATDVVALNFKTDFAGSHTIALDRFDGVFATGQDVYLVDSQSGTETNLKTGSYTFNANPGVDNTRFTLKFQKTLKVDEPSFNENSVRVYKENGIIQIKSGAIAISNVKVFDLQGRLVSQQKNVKSNTTSLPNLKASKQVLILKITGKDNRVVSKKIIN